jgi:AcrR family transcriptional regulator
VPRYRGIDVPESGPLFPDVGRHPAVRRRTQAERSTTTRAAILRSARALFAAQGYAQTGLDQVVKAAGVTRGALYHHFETKADLFEAVVDLVDADLFEQVVAEAAGDGDAIEWVRRAARAYIEVSLRSPDVRIASDAVAVLSPEAYRRISAARCLPIAELAAEAAAFEGAALPGDPSVLAAMLLGALDRAVALVADVRGEEAEELVVDTVVAVVDRILGLPS